MKLDKSFAAAALAGLFAAGTVMAAAPISGVVAADEKGSCSGKDGCASKDKSKDKDKSTCSGKDGCSGKDKKAGTIL